MHSAAGQQHVTHQTTHVTEGMADKYRDQLIRQQAEFENFRKRMRREMKQNLEQANQGLLETLLPVIDNFERALSHPGESLEQFVSGVEMIQRQMMDNLERFGLAAIKAEGQPFDPTLHEAVSVGDSEDAAEDEVIEVFQPGYTLNGRLLRPSMVKVCKK